MPITRRQFELGIDEILENWMAQIYKFLDANRDQAFSLKEIADALGLSGMPEHPGSAATAIPSKKFRLSEDERRFVLALNRLVELGVASEREVAGVAYYATGRYSLTEILEPNSRAS